MAAHRPDGFAGSAPSDHPGAHGGRLFPRHGGVHRVAGPPSIKGGPTRVTYEVLAREAFRSHLQDESQRTRTGASAHCDKHPSWQDHHHIPDPQKQLTTPSVIKRTKFVFSDQKEFPPKKKKDRRFDVEAFIELEGSFYLFTKNRDKSFNKATNVYVLPAQPGKQIATPIGKIPTCKDAKNCIITGASLHHPSGKIALLSHDRVWVISNYTGTNFLEGSIKEIPLKHKSQKESIAFKNENTLLIADERSKGEGGNLYVLSLL